MTQPAVPGPGVSLPDVVVDALAAPAGARWHRVALQVNPYGYQGMSAPSKKFPDEQSYNEAIVRAYHQGKIELIAITDHWCVRTSEGLARAAQDAGIVVLPGFEAVSSEGIHLLVLFERDTGYDKEPTIATERVSGARVPRVKTIGGMCSTSRSCAG